MDEHEQLPGLALEESPVFDGGTFTIDTLARTEEGLEIKTRQTLRRHEPGQPLPEADTIAQERRNEPINLRLNTIYPRKGESPEDLRNRLLVRKVGTAGLKLNPNEVVVEGDHVRFVPGFAPRVGPRNIAQHGNEVTMDVLPVTFPTYKAINDPNASKEMLEIANPAATAAILLTTEKDGSHKLVLQHRSSRNHFYGDVPGASIGGFLDAKLDNEPGQRGKILPIDTASILRNNLKEMEEELGLEASDIEDIKVMGTATDKVRYHTEFLLFGTLGLSIDEVAMRVEQRAKEKRPNDEFDFEGRFVVIDGTPEAIAKLLSEAKSPMPSTHAGALVATGYAIVLAEKGIDAANLWMEDLQKGLRDNYREMDEIVDAYYEENKIVRQFLGQHNGYNPNLLPSDQGLPSLESELQRTGLA